MKLLIVIMTSSAEQRQQYNQEQERPLQDQRLQERLTFLVIIAAKLPHMKLIRLKLRLD